LGGINAIGIACGHPVGRSYKPDRREDEDDDDAYFDDDNDVIDLGGFANTYDEQNGRDGDSLPGAFISAVVFCHSPRAETKSNGAALHMFGTSMPKSLRKLTT
jgi:hypothetical protein